jgi:hypothetical protein
MRIGAAETVGEHMGLTSASILLTNHTLRILPDVLNCVHSEYIKKAEAEGQSLVDYERILVPERGGYRVRIFFNENGDLSLTREWYPEKDR